MLHIETSCANCVFTANIEVGCLQETLCKVEDSRHAAGRYSQTKNFPTSIVQSSELNTSSSDVFCAARACALDN